MNQNNDLNTYLDIIANYNFTPLIDDVKNSPYLIIESLLVIFFYGLTYQLENVKAFNIEIVNVTEHDDDGFPIKIKKPVIFLNEQLYDALCDNQSLSKRVRIKSEFSTVFNDLTPKYYFTKPSKYQIDYFLKQINYEVEDKTVNWVFNQVKTIKEKERFEALIAEKGKNKTLKI